MVTLKELKSMGACQDGVEWYKKNKKKTFLETLEVTDNESINYFNWYLSKTLRNENLIKYAIYAAEQVLYLYEKWNPEDNRPRKAIDAAKKYLKNPTKENADAANSAADAAYAAANAAAYAANAAAYAANAAVYAAANAAVYAAYAANAAAYAANAAANAAAYAAANAAVYAAANAKEFK